MEGILIFASVIALSFGHLCLLAPPQRGSMEDVNKPGATDCDLTQGPCGERRPGHDAIIYPKNENITVTFMKNLNHFNQSGPGKFVITLMEPRGQNGTVLATIPDDNQPSLHIYSLHLKPPELSPQQEPHFLQVVYHTNNSTAPAEFYQCADVNFGPR